MEKANKFYCLMISGIKRSMMAKQNSLDDVGLELEGDDQVKIVKIINKTTFK